MDTPELRAKAAHYKRVAQLVNDAAAALIVTAGTGAAWHPFATKASCSPTSFIARVHNSSEFWRCRCSCVAVPAALYDQAQVVLAREIHRRHDVTRRLGGHSVDAWGRRPCIDPARGPGERRLFAQVDGLLRS